MLPEDVTEILCACLGSEDDQVLKLTMETLILFATLKSSQSEFSEAKNRHESKVSVTGYDFEVMFM